MKILGEIWVVVFMVAGLVEIAQSSCFVKNNSTSQGFLYQCSMSVDYLEDVNKAPIDVRRVTFTNSRIPIVKDRSFDRLRDHLERLAVFHSGVEEIEDNAFQGLTKLTLLAFPGNKLQVLKSAWFEGLVNLKDVSFPSNRIKHIDDRLFSILPPLGYMDLSLNEITCFPTASFGNFKLDDFQVSYNRLKPLCEADLIAWLTGKNIRYNHFDLDFSDTRAGVIRICSDKLPKSEMNDETLNKCIERTAHEFLPGKGNYTIQQMCKLLENTPSPFLDCNKL